jgi:hypothetical protein
VAPDHRVLDVLYGIAGVGGTSGTPAAADKSKL